MAEPQTTATRLAPAVLILMASFARADAPQAVPVDGEPFLAEIAAVDESWRIRFNAHGASRELSAADLVRWGRPREPRRGPLLVLADGGFLSADVLKADKKRLTADSALFGTIEVPLERIAGVILQLPADRHGRDLLLDTVSSAQGNADEAILTNGDRIAGRFESLSETSLQIQSPVGAVDIQPARLRAMIFNPSLLDRAVPPGLHWLAGFVDGSRLLANQVVLDAKLVKLTLSGGLAWTTVPEDLVFLQPQGGRAVYLSDLKADGYRHVPFLELPWNYYDDRNVTGGWLRAAGRVYAKGLGMHSASRIRYRLDGGHTRFDALLAVDDSAGGRGSVRFRVFVDGSPKYTSPTVRGGDPPLPVSVDLQGSQRLDLVVDFADRADERDHADWLEARLVKEP